MRKLTLVLFIVILQISCDNKNNPKYIPKSSGNINTLSVVMGKELWNSPVGDSIRAIFSSEFLGLPQQEAVLTLKHIPISAFSGFFRESRNILIIEKSKNAKWSLKLDQYANPQLVFIIKDQENTNIIKKLKEKKEIIIKKVQENELVEKQRRMRISPLKNTELKSLMALDILMPSAYELFKKDNNKFWFQKETKNGSVNILIYETEKIKNIHLYDLQKIIELRDSIGKIFVPGRNVGSYMLTEKAYEPYFKRMKIKEFNAIETRGTWELKNDFMAGPFLNYMINDTVNNRFLMLDGFVFSPSSRKREMIFEIEAIYKSLKIYKKESK